MDFPDPSHGGIGALSDVATARCGWFGVAFYSCGCFDGFGVGLFIAAAELLCPGSGAGLVSAAAARSAVAITFTQALAVGSTRESPQFSCVNGRSRSHTAQAELSPLPPALLRSDAFLHPPRSDHSKTN